MAIPEAYTNNVGNLTRVFEAIQNAGVPERVTFEFLKTLGFKSSNDRPIIGVLKAIGFLDASGTPTATYRAYRDRERGPKVMAAALRAAYSDIFLANTRAHELAPDRIQGIVASKTSKGDAVVRLIAATFKTLAKLGDFAEDGLETAPPPAEPVLVREVPKQEEIPRNPIPSAVPNTDGIKLHYNIQIHLPTTTDIAVYNAVFKALREHLI